MRRKYFFGYLFVRLAKWLAVLTLLVGLGTAGFFAASARVAAERARYQPSYELGQGLRELRSEWERSQRLVRAFKTIPEVSPAASRVEFPNTVETLGTFKWVLAGLAEIDRGRDALKELIVQRFGELTEAIESKLRAHAAQLAAAQAPPTAGGNARPMIPPPPLAADPLSASEMENLFDSLSSHEIGGRIERLSRALEFLRVLETSAENVENRKILGDSVTEIEALEKLLPPVPDAIVAEKVIAPSAAPAPLAAPMSRLNAQKVADQLVQLRASIRETLLTSWVLDSAFARAQSQAHAERAHCVVAGLAVKALWLSAAGKMAASIALAVAAAFLILVFADLLQTFFDTATNTGVAADAHRAA